MFLPKITSVFLETMGYVYTSGKTPEMAYTECVPFLRSIHNTKNKKENKKLWHQEVYSCKFWGEACRGDLCSATWVSCRQVAWLPLPKGWKRKRQLWASGYYTHVYAKRGNYMLLAVSSSLPMACCWQSRCFSQGIAWLFVNSFFPRRSQERVLGLYTSIFLQ